MVRAREVVLPCVERRDVCSPSKRALFAQKVVTVCSRRNQVVERMFCANVRVQATFVMRGKVIPIQLLLAVRLSSNLPLRYTQPALFPRLHLHPVESRDSARHTAMVGAASGQSLLPLHERARTFSSTAFPSRSCSRLPRGARAAHATARLPQRCRAH